MKSSLTLTGSDGTINPTLHIDEHRFRHLLQVTEYALSNNTSCISNTSYIFDMYKCVCTYNICICIYIYREIHAYTYIVYAISSSSVAARGVSRCVLMGSLVTGNSELHACCIPANALISCTLGPVRRDRPLSNRTDVQRPYGQLKALLLSCKS